MKTTVTLKNVSALDVKDGDVIYVEGYRVRVSDVTRHSNNLDVIRHDHSETARWTMNSAPNARNPGRLLYEGMTGGGNRLARKLVEMTPSELD